MKAVDVLSAQRDAAQQLAAITSKQHSEKIVSYLFTVELCKDLLRYIDVEAELDEVQAEFLSDKVTNVDYEFVAGYDIGVMTKELAVMNSLITLSLFTYIKTCST